jgi:hypothetical protein
VSEAKAVGRKIGTTATILAKTLSAKTSISGQSQSATLPQAAHSVAHCAGGHDAISALHSLHGGDARLERCHAGDLR